MDGDVLKRYQAAKEVKRNYERNGKLNLAFIKNEQWVTYDKTTDNLKLMLPEAQKPRLTSNLIRKRLRREFGEFTAIPPNISVRCTTQEQSKKVYYYLDDIMRTYKYLNEFKTALKWAQQTGTGGVKRYYDFGAGPAYGNVRGGAPLILACSLFEMSWDPFASSPDEASYVFYEKLRSQEYVKLKWGKEVAGGGTGLLYPSIYAMRVRVKPQNVPSVLVTEYWERPNAENPQGRYMVFAEAKEVLYDGPNPYAEFDPIPFSIVRYDPDAGELYGDTWVTEARQPNVLYNRLRSDMLENAAKLSNPPLISPLGAITGDVEMNPGDIIKYNPMAIQGGKIDQLKIEPFPPQVVNTLKQIEQEVDEAANISTRAGMPRGVRSAQQFSALQRDQDQARQPILDEYAEMIKDTLQGVLRQTRHFMKLPRYVYAGNEAILFKGDDIPDDALVVVKAELKPVPPTQEEQQMLFSLLDRRIVQDPRPIVRLAHYGNSEEVFKDIDLDSQQQQRENRKMLEGVPVQVEDWHNHLIHLAELNRFRKTEDFEKLPPQIQALFNQHGAMHQQALVQLAPKEGMTPNGPPAANPNGGPA